MPLQALTHSQTRPPPAGGVPGAPAQGAPGERGQSPDFLGRREAHGARTRAWFDRLAPQRARWKARNCYYYQEIERLARAVVPPGATVLELGCGTGDLLALRPSLGVGVDLSGGMVRQARARYGWSPRADAGSRLLFLQATPTPCPWARPSTT